MEESMTTANMCAQSIKAPPDKADTPLNKAFNRQGAVLNDLEKMIDGLTVKLNPILANLEPEQTGEGKSDGGASEVVRTIDENTNRIRESIRVITMLIDKVEL